MEYSPRLPHSVTYTNGNPADNFTIEVDDMGVVMISEELVEILANRFGWTKVDA